MTDAMVVGVVKISALSTSIDKVQMFYLDTKLDYETIKAITSEGFSRIPIAFSQEHPVVIGILLVKTLLCV